MRTTSKSLGTPIWWPSSEINNCLTVHLDPLGTPDLPFPGAEARILSSAIDRWQSVADECGAPFCIEYGGSMSAEEGLTFNPRGPNPHVVAFIPTAEQWAEFESSRVIALTITLTRPEDGRIVDSDIVINDSRYVFSHDVPLPSGTLDIESIMMHELGHMIGFEHTEDPTSIMQEGPVTALSRWELGAADKAGVCEMFACY